MLHRTCLGLAVVAATTLTGCGGTDTQPPPPTTTSATPTSTTTTTQPTTTTETPRPTVAPPVSTPVDLSRHVGHPCAILDGQQQAELGLLPAPYENIPPQETSDDGFGLCTWSDPPGPHAGASYGYSIRIQLTEDLLTEAYQDSNSTDPVYSEPNWPVFIARTIRGLPAVVRTRTELTFACEVVIGTGNGQGLAIKGVHTPDDPSLCDRMVTMAELVVDSVRR